ncbi:D-glucuronyl C5-epimerase family protein [Ornithinimicrobium sp. LYQ121]|uniref:D-glucuronyl C5-epimerase family protein n=1 Tax=Ornithinimicrobium sp. LYQ121 TaxID=3378801 RepID=UPI0038555E87
MTPRPVDAARERIDGFSISAVAPQPIPLGMQPYQSGEVVPLPFGLVDSTGVRMFEADWDDTVYDHPIAQAQYGLSALESYRLTGDPEYLDVATRNAQRIVDRRDEIDGAWYFPYDFDFDLFRNGKGVLTAPWASGMSSGQALSLFVRLHEVTGEKFWRDAADHTFAAFLQAPDGVGYFSSFVDDAGMLWLEEYSRYPVMDSERVLNGHMWSMYGIWDYWMMNDYDHPDAELLWRGAMYTVDRTAEPVFRTPEWYSLYSVWQKKEAPTYHWHHQQQFLMLYRMSHDTAWVDRAATFRDDHPAYRTAPGRAVVAPRTTTAYRLDDDAQHVSDRSMVVLETQPVDLDGAATVDYDRRGRIPQGPVVIRLTSGHLEGWWVPEGPDQAWSTTPVEVHEYRPAVVLRVTDEVETTATRYDEHGTPIDTQEVTLQPGRLSSSYRSGVVEGRPAWQLSGGEIDGYWVPAQDKLRVDAAGNG